MQTPILMKLVDDRLPIDDKSYTLSAVITFHTRLNSTVTSPCRTSSGFTDFRYYIYNSFVFTCMVDKNNSLLQFSRPLPEANSIGVTIKVLAPRNLVVTIMSMQLGAGKCNKEQSLI